MTESTLNKTQLREPIKILYSDLPLCCPMPDQQLWNQHPRVYLAIEKTGEVSCPYCGNHYQLDQALKQV